MSQRAPLAFDSKLSVWSPLDFRLLSLSHSFLLILSLATTADFNSTFVSRRPDEPPCLSMLSEGLRIPGALKPLSSTLLLSDLTNSHARSELRYIRQVPGQCLITCAVPGTVT
jgi:hypothetical protein